MKLGLQLGYWQRTPYQGLVELTQEAERLGYNSVWTGEAYGSDAWTPLTWVGAHTKKIRLGTSVMQISARTPTCAAMSALTLDHLSEGRVIVGIGVSGPQVVEGWYGMPFKQPLARTREWIDIFRKVIERKMPVEHAGQHYQLPYTGAGSMSLGKPLKSITHPLRPHIPIFIGAEGPKNVAQTLEIADGWFPIFLSPYHWDIYGGILDNAPKGFEFILTGIGVHVNDNLEEALLPTKQMLALYIGGMGARNVNFHKQVIERMGYTDEAQQVQELYLAGEKDKAVAAVPDRLADEISLSGPKERIVERLQDWKKTPLTEMVIGRTDNLKNDIDRLRFFAEITL